MGMGGNGKPPQWEWELPGNLFPKFLCCDELIKLLVLYLPDANAYCANFADIQQLVKQKSDRISFLEAKGMLIYQIYTFAFVSCEPV